MSNYPKIYSKDFDLRTTDFDCYTRLLPSSVLDLFQVAAGEHANLLDCGIDSLFERQLMWMLLRVKYCVIDQPALFERVRVKTWPLAAKRVGFERDYLIEGEDGRPLIKGTSDWVVVHSERKKIMPTAGIYPEAMEFLTDRSFEERPVKLKDFETDLPTLSICPGFSALDMNGHVNNTKYAGFALDALNPKRQDEIIAFQIDYRHEVKLGEALSLFTSVTNGLHLVKGVDSAGETKFVCSAEYR